MNLVCFRTLFTTCCVLYLVVCLRQTNGVKSPFMTSKRTGLMPTTKVYYYRGRQPTKGLNFRPYRFMIDQKPRGTPRPRRLLNISSPKSFSRTKWRRKKTKKIYPRRNRYLSNRRNDDGDSSDERVYFEENNEDGEVLRDNGGIDEPITDRGESQSGDIHIHLKSLLDTELVSYLMSEVPWEDFFRGNQLTRTEEVKYITESLIEEGDEDEDHSKFGWNRETEKGNTWMDNNEYQRRYEDEADSKDETLVEEGLDLVKDEVPQPSEVRKISMTHTVRHEDCPYYFSRSFQKWNKHGLAKTSLLGYMECEKEKNLGSNPFGGFDFDTPKPAKDRSQNQRLNSESKSQWYQQRPRSYDVSSWEGYNAPRNNRRRKPIQSHV